MAMRRIGDDERRARLGARHGLARPGPNPVEAARSVVALHSTDPASVFLSLRARVKAVTPAQIEKTLYVDRTLMRMLGMRRTMFVVPTDVAPVVQASSTRDVAANQRRLYTKLLGQAGLGDGAWLAEIEDASEKALAARGEATGSQLSADVPLLRTQIQLAEGKAYGAKVNITTWVLTLLAADGRIVRGRPRGTWSSSQYHWSPVQAWLPGGLAELDVDQARVELARQWLRSYGPGTVADLRWWTGWTVGQVRKALAALDPVEVEISGGTGLVLPGDEPPTAQPKPWVALLPALDPTPMGWSERSWYLGEHAAALFDRSGNIGPSIWSDGRIVGGWAQRADGEVVYRLLEDVGREAASKVAAAAADLGRWIGPVRVTPRFRTPLERELRG
jgi:Winged helix DNA-binding domain